MNASPPSLRAIDPGTEHFDILIVGAGISGIDAARHLRKHRPATSFAIVESKPQIGGTWHTHTFPGIRSDSDLFTFGFSWKPWTGVPIATGEEILRYLEEAIDEEGIREKIRFNLQVETAEWSSDTQRWTLTVRRGADGAVATMTCGFLWMCAGYFRHSHGYTPDWPGMGDFRGEIVHPQNWPHDLDHAGKRVVVIGSGATAATLVPAIATDAALVAMVQRSPTFYYPRPKVDDFNATLSALGLPDELYHEIMRRKFLHDNRLTVQRSFTEPEALAADLIGAARAYLGDDYDMDTHFTPSYRPWRQRVAMVPDGDLFVAIREGRAEILTDHIERFTEIGLRLSSGKEVAADIIVTATGLNLTMFGDIVLTVDNLRVDPAKCVTHRGIMFTGLPNFATVFGYLRSSWTLRADLVSRYLCRMLDHMDALGANSVTPTLGSDDRDMELRPWIDPENFNAGYIMRSLDALPRQGDHQPWLMTQDYFRDNDEMPAADLDDCTLLFRRANVLAGDAA